MDIDPACSRCRLVATRTHVVPGRGPIPCDLMGIGEGPGQWEDEKAQCWVGKAGKLLDAVLAHAGISAIYLTNRVRCRPPDNRDPYDDELTACRPWLDAELAVVKPKVVLLLGLYATDLMFPGKAINKIAGHARFHDGRVWVPAPHPAAMLHGARPEYMGWLQAAAARARLEVARC